jgi:hypothetical protein
MSKNTTHQNSFYNCRKEFKVNNTDQQDQMGEDGVNIVLRLNNKLKHKINISKQSRIKLNY